MISTMSGRILVGVAILFLVGCGDPDSSPFGGGQFGGAPGRGGNSVAAGGKGGGAAGAGGRIVEPPGGGGAAAVSSGGAAGAPVVGAGGSGGTAAGGVPGPAAGTGGAPPASSGGSAAPGGGPGAGGRPATGGTLGTGGTGAGGRGGATVTATGGAGGAGPASSGGAIGTGGTPGVCRPGDVQFCQGNMCTGTATCTSAGQWGACPCSPPPGTGGVTGVGGAGGAAGAGGSVCTQMPKPAPEAGPTCSGSWGSATCFQAGKVCWDLVRCDDTSTACVTPCSAITCAADQVKQQDLGQDCKCVAGPPPPPPPTYHGLLACAASAPASGGSTHEFVGCPNQKKTTSDGIFTFAKTAPDGVVFLCVQCSWYAGTACAVPGDFMSRRVYCATSCSDCDP